MTSAMRKQVVYKETSRYHEALGFFQRGDWETGLNLLGRVLDEYPEEEELQTLKREMEMRARLADDEKVERKQTRQRRLIKIAIWVVVLSTLVYGAFWGAITYSPMVASQVSLFRNQMQTEMKTLEVDMTFRNAQNLLLAGQVEEARVLFAEVARLDPDYPQLEQYLEKSEDVIRLQSQYDQAKRLLDAGQSTSALLMFEEISLEDPNYYDVQVQIDTLRRSLYMENLLEDADSHFSSQRWNEAITAYIELRALDVSYRSDYVEGQLYSSLISAAEEVLADPSGSLEDLALAEYYFRKALALRPQSTDTLERRSEVRIDLEERLFRSYVNAANRVLIGKTDSLEALAEAEKYFIEALKLRPNDAQIQSQREMARLYLQAQQDFTQRRWDAAIDALEYVCGIDLMYAEGTAAQTLYEAYMARGKGQLSGGSYEKALLDFRRAAVLAGQGEDGTMRNYEAQTHLAYIEGLLGNFENAVVIYRAAMEMAGISAQAEAGNPPLAKLLQDAENAVARSDYRTAYRHYRDASEGVIVAATTVKHTVASGEYLTQLALRYNTTVSAILNANQVNDLNRLLNGQVLVIPVMKSQGD